LADRFPKAGNSSTATSESSFKSLDALPKYFNCRSHFIKQQKQERQARLYDIFGFICDCEACTGNYPTPPELSFKDIKQMKFATKTDEELLKLPFGRAMKKYRECCDTLEKSHKNFPCLEFSVIQKCIITFLLIQAQPAIKFP
jgi:hypothetical protein